MKKLLFLFIATIIICDSPAQITFEKSVPSKQNDLPVSIISKDSIDLAEMEMNNTYESVAATSDGGYISLGSGVNGFGTNLQLIKLNHYGEVQWEKYYGGNVSDKGYKVRQTVNGEYLVVGTTSSYGSGASDILIIRTDSSGNELWSETFGGTGDETGIDVLEISDGSIVIAGKAGSDAFALKVSEDGILLWMKIFGGANEDRFNSIAHDADGFSFTGETNSFGSGDSDIYLVRTDLNGNEIWSRAIGSEGWESGNSSKWTTDGSLVISGVTTGYGAGNGDVFLVKTDSYGTVQWQRTYGGSETDNVYSLKRTFDGGYIMAGETYSFNGDEPDMYLIKTDNNGILIWSHIYGGIKKDVATDVDVVNDGGFIVTGLNQSVGNNAETILIKTDQYGKTECMTDTIISSMGNAFFNSVSVYAASVTASFSSSLSSMIISDHAEIEEMRVICSHNTTTTIAANFVDVLTNPIPDSLYSTDQVLASKSFQKNLTNDSFNVFPNPGNGTDINISLSAEEGDQIIVVVYDITGKQHYSKILVVQTEGGNVFGIDPENKLTKGIYFITASSQKGNFSRKLIVE